jgi:TusA-related sulfurtransferase
MQRPQFKPRLLCLTLLALTLPAAAPVFGQNPLPSLGDRISGTVSLDQEYRMGQQFLTQLRRSAPTIPDALLKAKLALNGMQADQVLKVVATDPGSERDFHLFVEQSDHQILDFQKDDSAYSYWIRKG